MARQKKEQLFKLLNGGAVATDKVASSIRMDGLLVLLNPKGHQISYTKLDEGVEGKTELDADVSVSELYQLGDKAKNPFIQFGNGSGVRCAAITAIEEHIGRDYQGVIVRGDDDAVLAFLPVSSAENVENIATTLHEAHESYIVGKFVQPNLADFLKVSKEHRDETVSCR